MKLLKNHRANLTEGISEKNPYKAKAINMLKNDDKALGIVVSIYSKTNKFSEICKPYYTEDELKFIQNEMRRSHQGDYFLDIIRREEIGLTPVSDTASTQKSGEDLRYEQYNKILDALEYVDLPTATLIVVKPNSNDHKQYPSRDLETLRYMLYGKL